MATAADRRAFVAEHVNADLAYILDDAAVNETHQFALAAGLGSPCSDAADCRSAQLLVCSAAFNACGKAAMQQTAVLPNVIYCSAAVHLYLFMCVLLLSACEAGQQWQRLGCVGSRPWAAWRQCSGLPSCPIPCSAVPPSVLVGRRPCCWASRGSRPWMRWQQALGVLAVMQLTAILPNS